MGWKSHNLNRSRYSLFLKWIFIVRKGHFADGIIIGNKRNEIDTQHDFIVTPLSHAFNRDDSKIQHQKKKIEKGKEYYGVIILQTKLNA